MLRALLFYAILFAAPLPGAELFEAIRNGTSAEVRAALAMPGVNAAAKDETGTPALVVAAVFNSLDTMKALIEAGADVNAANGVFTSLR